MKRLLIITFFILFVASCSSSDETSTVTTTSPPTTLTETTTTLAETTTTLAETTTTVAETTTTTPPAPGPVEGLLITPGSESLNVTWDRSKTNDITPDTYEIRWRKHTDPPSSWWGYATKSWSALSSTCSVATNLCSYTIEGLENGTETEIEIRARTDEGGKSDAAVGYGTPLAIYESEATLEEFMTGPFSWGPSDDATTLQIVLGFDREEIDGWYGFDTYQAHVNELIGRDLSIENVPEPPNLAPIASSEGEWVAPDWDLVDCELAIFDMAPLCGVEINTPSAEAIAMLVSILGPASEDTGWNDEAGCAAIGQSWRERKVSWGEIDAVFNGLNPSVFSGWRVYRNLPPLEANWPDFPISLPNGLYLGDPLEEVAAMMGYDAEELSMYSFEEYGLPGIYRFSSPEFGYQYGQSYPRINGIIDDTLLMHIASPGLPAFIFCD